MIVFNIMLGFVQFTLGVFILGALAGYLTTCLVSSAQANLKVIRLLATVGTVSVLLGALSAIPQEKPKPTSKIFELKSEPHTD